MFDAKILDELSHKLAGALPPGLQELRDDLQKNFRSTLQGALGKLDLVTREEFDVQTQVLARTRSKLETLEKQLAELEALINKDAKPNS
ncbi:MAG: accessory factor UbiK family protein [Gammaproteobacteria bacterium]|nr:accessory factor UbiK family protein [Gammaproteobacteria bacterium]